MFRRNRDFKAHHIGVKDNVKPVVTPVRKVPHALKPKLQKELKRMVDLDITELIEKPTGGVNGLVIVEKPNGKLRICLNPQRYKARTPSSSHCRENISTNVWCLLFLKTRCFLGILANKSRWGKLTLLAFGTPLGRYRFKRLPNRIHSVSEVFQRVITSIISDVPGSTNPQDDTIVWGRTLAEHNECFWRFTKVY